MIPRNRVIIMAGEKKDKQNPNLDAQYYDLFSDDESNNNSIDTFDDLHEHGITPDIDPQTQAVIERIKQNEAELHLIEEVNRVIDEISIAIKGYLDKAAAAYKAAVNMQTELKSSVNNYDTGKSNITQFITSVTQSFMTNFSAMESKQGFWKKLNEPIQRCCNSISDYMPKLISTVQEDK